MRGAILLAVPLLLAACDNREVVAICAATGDAETQITAARHADDGTRAVLRWDGTEDRATVARDTLETPLLAELWRMAETTMRALPDTEPSPCGEVALSAVRVIFSDGTVAERQTTCTGNALSRVAHEVTEASNVDAALSGATEESTGPVASLLDACERLR